MYSDPTLIRKHRMNLSFNQREHALLIAVCEFTGAEPAAFIRELALERAMEVLGHGMQSAGTRGELRDVHPALLSA